MTQAESQHTGQVAALTLSTSGCAGLSSAGTIAGCASSLECALWRLECLLAGDADVARIL